MEKLPSPRQGSSRGPIPSETFVRTDATTFKEIVQRLTGPGADQAPEPISTAAPAPGPGPSSKAPTVKRPKFKIQERRQGPRPKLTITRPNPSSVPPLFTAGIASPSSSSSPLISPSNVFSGLTLTDDERGSSTSMNLDLDSKAEEEAIKDKRFYLHPSPWTLTPKNADPELLPLFPLSSPKTLEP